MCTSSVCAKISIIALIAIGIIVTGIDAKPPRRIIEGEDADPNEFPWMVRLNVSIDDETYDCGGAIISPRHVLTAAHCLREYTLNSVWTGLHIRDFNIAVKSNPAQIIVHPQYKLISDASGASWAENDLGIIVLDKDLKLGANQAVIPLANKETTVGTRGTVSGWGFTDIWSYDPTMILQKSTIDIQPADQCWVQRAEQLCGRSPPDATPCHGDSGSPLVVDDRLVGIVSSSKCFPGLETMFTSVYYHLAWIKSNIEKSSV